MMSNAELKAWLATLPEDAHIGVAEGRLSLVGDGDHAYLEVGSVPGPDAARAPAPHRSEVEQIAGGAATTSEIVVAPQRGERCAADRTPVETGALHHNAVVEVSGGCAELSYHEPGVNVALVDHDELEARLADGDEQYVIETIEATPELEWADSRYDYPPALKRKAGVKIP